MEPVEIQQWLSIAMDGEDITGAMLVDARYGLCLGKRGTARESDAAVLADAANGGALDEQKGAGAVRYADSTVLLRRVDQDVLVAIFKGRRGGGEAA